MAPTYAFISEDEQPEPKTLHTMLTKKSSRLWAWGAIALQSAVVLMLTLVVVKPIYLANPGVVSNTNRTLFIAGITVIATLVCEGAASQTKELWIAHTYPSSNSHNPGKSRIQQLATILGVSSFWGSVFKTPYIVAAFAINGLVTTAIVAGLTPSATCIKYPHFSNISSTLTPRNIGDDCYSSNSFTRSEPGLNWTLANGTNAYLNAGVCTEPFRILRLLQSPSFEQIEDYYTIGGILVHRTALGAPLNVLQESQGSGPLALLSPIIGNKTDMLDNFEWASACLPVLEENPVRCEQAGATLFSDDNHVSVSSGTCQGKTTPVFNYRQNGAFGAVICEDDEVGSSTVLVGAVRKEGTAYPQMLAAIFLEDPNVPGPDNFTVTCHVTPPRIVFRSLNYSMANSSLSKSGSFQVVGGEACIPHDNSNREITVSDILTDEMRMLSAASSLYLLLEGWWSDGVPTTLMDLAKTTLPTYFANSRNHFEDTLGLASALALSLVWGGGHGSQVQSQSSLCASGVRVGPGTWWAFVFILPSMFSIGLLAWLLWVTRERDSKTI